LDIEKQLAAALARVAGADRQTLMNMRANAVKYGVAATELIEAINLRLAELGGSDAMARHRLDFARSMLRIAMRERLLQWTASRDLFLRAQVEDADNPFVVWMKGNTARQIPVTKALADVLPEFPDIEWRKDGPDQGARVWCRRIR
jgi:hypothetical protein